MSQHSTVYKITPRLAWENAERESEFTGAPIDLADGFIHFSTADQTAETAAKHFAGQDDLLLVAINVQSLGEKLKWEVSRGSALFPHLYDTLSMNAVIWAKPMPLMDGAHVLPELQN